MTKQILLKRGGIKVFGLLFVINFLIGYVIGYYETEETIRLYFKTLNTELEAQNRKKKERLKEQFEKANRGAATVGQVIDPVNVMVESSWNFKKSSKFFELRVNQLIN